MSRRYFSAPHTVAAAPGAASLSRGATLMFIHRNDPACSAATLATSRQINASPHRLARTLQGRGLFSSAVYRSRLQTVAIHLASDPAERGAVTFRCLHTGTSERRPLRTGCRSTWNLTAETEDGAPVAGMSGTPTFALKLALTPLIRPGRPIATRVSLTFHFVREPWWPPHMTDALARLADLWLQRLEEQARSTA